VPTHNGYLGTAQIRRKCPLRWSRHASVCAAAGEVVEQQAQLDGAARQRGLVNLGPQRATAVDRRLNSKLDAHAKTFGFKEMTCLWREAVDGATPEIKRQYAQMHRAPAQGAAMSTSTGRWSEAGALRRLDG
jgi:hypothetical protein